MKFGDFTRAETVVLLEWLGGTKIARQILKGREMPEVKYGGLTRGQDEALVNVLGGEEKVRAVLAGDLEVKLEEADRKFFDRHGRCIPSRGLASAVCDPNRDFYLEQPEIDYKKRLARLKKHFSEGTTFCSIELFKKRSQALLEKLRGDDQMANVLKGVYLPICLPQMEIDDYGRALEVFLAAVKDSYENQFSGRKFYNNRAGELANQVSVAEGSRHEKLIVKMAEGPVVGIYFPNPLQGFSINADREQIVSLPEAFPLSGGFDTATTIAAYPDVLARNFNTPGLDLAALSWRSAGYSLNFKANGDELGFDGTGNLASADDDSSGGLLFLG